MAGSSGYVSGNLPMLDGKNSDDWCEGMNAIFNFKDMEEIVKNGFQELGRSASDEQKKIHKEAKKMDCKAQFLIHQCVDVANFGKTSKAMIIKEAWDILNKAYGGANKTKKVKLQDL
ncbi:hypothetical protein HKD37_01G000875 [Glycine soja]|nr:hypothetical protein GmHk_01G000913 [Glycine max]